jgi:hypothetical protein
MTVPATTLRGDSEAELGTRASAGTAPSVVRNDLRFMASTWVGSTDHIPRGGARQGLVGGKLIASPNRSVSASTHQEILGAGVTGTALDDLAAYVASLSK